jgi:hypothetical protein
MEKDLKENIEPKKGPTYSEKDLLAAAYVVAKKEEMKLDESISNGMALLFESPRPENHCCSEPGDDCCCGEE